MEKARRKLRACLVCVVVVAVIIGLVYYFHDVKGVTSVSDGTLITIVKGSRLWQW